MDFTFKNMKFRNPFCVFEMRSGKTDFSLSAIVAEANLYNTDKSEIGRQLFRNSLGLLPFGKQFIMEVLIVTDILPVVNAVFLISPLLLLLAPNNVLRGIGKPYVKSLDTVHFSFTLIRKPPHCLLKFHFFSQCCMFFFRNPFSTLYYIASNLWGFFLFVSKNIFSCYCY